MSFNTEVLPITNPHAPNTEPTSSADSTLERTLNHRHNEEELLLRCFFTTDDCHHDPVLPEAASDASLIAAIRTLYQRNDQLQVTLIQLHQKYPYLVSEKDKDRLSIEPKLYRPNNALDSSETDILQNNLQAQPAKHDTIAEELEKLTSKIDKSLKKRGRVSS
jgi:hypothetical protein